MRLRIMLEASRGATYEQTLALARTTEEEGFDAFFRSDHYVGIFQGDPTFFPTDSWTTLAGLARETGRVRLGTLVTASTFRHPSQLATAVATVDAMSGGRAELGIGAAWHPLEHRMYGFPFPPIGRRIDRLEEQLEIITGLWTTPPGPRFSFRGQHFQLEECTAFPRPAQQPRPTIIIGGAGPRRTPTLAARFADGFDAGFGSGLQERFANFRRICDEVGRDVAEVRLSSGFPVFCGTDAAEVDRRVGHIGESQLRNLGVCGRPEAVVEALGRLAEAGADTAYLFIYDVEDLDHVRLLGREVLPRAAAIEPSLP
jgi:F420-dependent oxidoreductase-like protein